MVFKERRKIEATGKVWTLIRNRKGKEGRKGKRRGKGRGRGEWRQIGGAGRKWVESSHLTNSRKTKCSGAKHFMHSVHRPAKVLPQDLTGGSRPLCNVFYVWRHVSLPLPLHVPPLSFPRINWAAWFHYNFSCDTISHRRPGKEMVRITMDRHLWKHEPKEDIFSFCVFNISYLFSHCCDK